MQLHCLDSKVEGSKLFRSVVTMPNDTALYQRRLVFPCTKFITGPCCRLWNERSQVCGMNSSEVGANWYRPVVRRNDRPVRTDCKRNWNRCALQIITVQNATLKGSIGIGSVEFKPMLLPTSSHGLSVRNSSFHEFIRGVWFVIGISNDCFKNVADICHGDADCFLGGKNRLLEVLFRWAPSYTG